MAKKQPFIDRMIGWVSPGMAAKRAYSREFIKILPSLTGTPARDDRPYPRDYTREHDEPPRAGATAPYGSTSQSRVDNGWAYSRSLTGSNAPTNRWRLTRMRDRARQLDRDNVLVTGMLDRAAENVIGHGMRMRATTADPEFNKAADDLWPQWMDQADIMGMAGGAEFQRILHRTFLRDGDIGLNLVSRGDLAYLQAIEGELIDTKSGGYDPAQNIASGIRFNTDGRPIGFNVVDYSYQNQTEIPARNFIFYCRRKNFSQIRGEPCFTQVDRLFDQIDGYVEASVIAARMAACFGLLIKKRGGASGLEAMAQQIDAKGKLQRFESMEPGMVKYLMPDEDIEQITPQQPISQFEQFVTTLIRFSGLTIGLPLELVFLDFSKTTYSSARASLLQAYRTFRSQQQIFIRTVMARIYQWRVSKWVKDGTLTPNAAAANDFWRHEWIAPGWAWIDPTKEIQAAMMEIDAGINSEENIALQHGRTIEDIYKSKSKAAKLAAEMKLVISRSSMTREMILMPSGQPTPSTVDPNANRDEPKTDPKTGEDILDED